MTDPQPHPNAAPTGLIPSLTRRNVLTLGVGGASVLFLSGLTVRGLSRGWLRGAYITAAYPALGRGMLGRLDSGTLKTLELASQTLIGAPPTAHYQRYFEWHATHVSGYREIYQRFTRYLNSQAHDEHGTPFTDCGDNDRRALLSTIMDQRSHHAHGNHLSRIWSGLVRRDLVRYDTYILQEILHLYSRTDGYLAIGYDAFPGEPAGLDAYRQPPAGL